MSEKMRQAFEAWISAPPFEHDCKRRAMDERATYWPGQYKRYETQIAWEAWQAALADPPAPSVPHWLLDVLSQHIAVAERSGWNGLHGTLVVCRDMIAAPPWIWRDPSCFCARCDMEHNGLPTQMSVCDACGDKRCPRAEDHRNECTRRLFAVAPEVKP